MVAVRGVEKGPLPIPPRQQSAETGGSGVRVPPCGLDQMHTKGQGEDEGKQLGPTCSQQAHKILRRSCCTTHALMSTPF